MSSKAVFPTPPPARSTNFDELQKSPSIDKANINLKDAFGRLPTIFNKTNGFAPQFTIDQLTAILKYESTKSKVLTWLPATIGVMVNSTLALTVGSWSIFSVEFSEINSQISNFTNISAFMYSLFIAQAMGNEIAKLNEINNHISNEATAIKKASVFLSLMPFDKKLGTYQYYLITLKQLRNCALQSLWETLSFGEQSDNVRLLHKMLNTSSQESETEQANIFTTLNYIKTAIEKACKQECAACPLNFSNCDHYGALETEYIKILNDVTNEKESRIAKQSLKFQLFLWTLAMLLMVTMFIGALFTQTSSGVFNLLLCALITIGILGCLVLISDLQYTTNGILKCNNSSLWLIIYELTLLIDHLEQDLKQVEKVSDNYNLKVLNLVNGTGNDDISETSINAQSDALSQDQMIKKKPKSSSSGKYRSSLARMQSMPGNSGLVSVLKSENIKFAKKVLMARGMDTLFDV